MGGRNLSDGTEGGFNGPSEIMWPWTPAYRCKQGTPVTDTLDVASSKTLRQLEQGELVEALDTPEVDKTSGLLRSRIRCDKDGLCGFATVRSSHGTCILELIESEA